MIIDHTFELWVRVFFHTKLYMSILFLLISFFYYYVEKNMQITFSRSEGILMNALQSLQYDDGTKSAFVVTFN